MTMTPDGYMLIDTSGVGQDALASDAYDSIITMLRTMFDIVLVNAGSDYRQPMNIRHVYPIADQIVYVATPLRYTISDMFLWVKYVTTRGIKAKNVLLTMNMCRKNGYSVKAIESLSDEFLPAQARGVMPFVASLPFLDDITGAWNNDTSDTSGFTRFLGDDRIRRALDPLIYAIDDDIRD
jgi:MinD-like ATPase involved in chromosome partitioning or flagellar assembly